MRAAGLILRLILVATFASAAAQSSPECPVPPGNLAAMRNCYRPLLVFAPSYADARLAAQREALDRAADDMMDRNVLLVPVVGVGSGASDFVTPLDAPFALLGAGEVAAVRRRFGVAARSFRVVLLGEDGEAKLRSTAPVAVDRLNQLIDTMPTRKLEMQRPHSN